MTFIDADAIASARAPLLTLATGQQDLLPGRAMTLPTAVIRSNMDVCGDPGFAERTIRGAYRARDIILDPVRLVALAPGAIVYGGNMFLLQTLGAMVEEQISPLIDDLPALTQHLRRCQYETVDIDAETVLVARYGEDVWGHWLAEILPRAILAEHAYPGRFRFAVAAHTTVHDDDNRFARAVRQSLAAYGIGEDRLIRLELDRSYRFRRLFTVASLWSRAALHPDVAALMRSLVQGVPDTGTKRLAVLRRDTAKRTLLHPAPVIEALTRRGYTFGEMGQLDFVEQVALFRAAETVFGVLGSGLASLIYSPEQVRVAVIAPANWFDCYFYMLTQLRGGLYAEQRAVPLWDGHGLPRDAPLVADPTAIEAMLDALDVFDPATAPDTVTVCGITLPRTLPPPALTIDFSAAGNSADFRRDGWSGQEELSVYSIGPRSTMTLPRPAIETDALIELEVATFTVPPYLMARRLIVSVNGLLVGDFAIAEIITVDCVVPRACFADQPALSIVFDHPVCPPATVLGAGTDTRELGIGFIALRIRPAAVSCSRSECPPPEPAHRPA